MAIALIANATFPIRTVLVEVAMGISFSVTFSGKEHAIGSLDALEEAMVQAFNPPCVLRKAPQWRLGNALPDKKGGRCRKGHPPLRSRGGRSGQEVVSW